MPPLRLSTVVSSCDSPELLITTVCVLSVHQQQYHLSDVNAIHRKHVATEFVFVKNSWSKIQQQKWGRILLPTVFSPVCVREAEICLSISLTVLPLYV